MMALWHLYVAWVRPIQKSNDWMMKFEVLMMADIAVAVHVAKITIMLLIRFLFYQAVKSWKIESIV